MIESNGAGTTSGAFGHVEIKNNGFNGIVFYNSTQTINMTASDSLIANNGTNGIYVRSGGSPENVIVRNSTISNNANIGLTAEGTGASIRTTRSTITGNGTGWSNAFSGAVTSYADNNIEDNGSVNNAPTQIIYK